MEIVLVILITSLILSGAFNVRLYREKKQMEDANVVLAKQNSGLQDINNSLDLIFTRLSLVPLKSDELNLEIMKQKIEQIVVEYESVAQRHVEFNSDILESLRLTIQHMQLIDYKGTFESDDEVGSTFEALRDVIVELEKFNLENTKRDVISE